MVKSLIGLLLVFTLAGRVLAQEPAPSTALHLDVPSPVVNVGSTIAIGVQVENATNLFGLQITCLPDAAIVSSPTVVFRPDWDPANRLEINQGVQPDGSLVFALSLTQGAVSSLNGNVGFADIAYVGSAPGSATLRCTATGSDREGNALQVAEASIVLQVVDPAPVQPTVEPPTAEPPTFTPVPTEVPATPTELPTLEPTPTVESTLEVTPEPTLLPTLDPVTTLEPTPEIPIGPTLTVEPVLSATPTATLDPLLTPTATPSPDPLLTPSATVTPDLLLTPSPTSTETPFVEPTMTPTSAPGQITGAVVVPFAADSSGVLVIFTPPDGNAVSAVLDGGGAFTFVAALPGTYIIDVSMPGYLPVRATLTLVAGESQALPPVSLQTGDTNNDGQVDVSDAALIAANFNGPALTPEADLNRDGIIDIRDLTLLGSRYGLAGPLNWS